MITVLIRALTPLSQAGLEQMIGSEPAFVIVRATAGSFELTLEEVPPDVVVAEADTDQESPWEAAMELSDHASAVVILTEGQSPSWAAEAIAAGVRAILPRSVSREALLGTLQAVASGLAVFHPDDLSAISGGRPGTGTPTPDGEPLTPREQQVLSTLSEGLSNKEIATRLSISEHTAKFHVAAIMSKLGATSRTEAVTLAIRRGLLMI